MSPFNLSTEISVCFRWGQLHNDHEASSYKEGRGLFKSIIRSYRCVHMAPRNHSPISDWLSLRKNANEFTNHRGQARSREAQTPLLPPHPPLQCCLASGGRTHTDRWQRWALLLARAHALWRSLPVPALAAERAAFSYLSPRSWWRNAGICFTKGLALRTGY